MNSLEHAQNTVVTLIYNYIIMFAINIDYVSQKLKTAISKSDNSKRSEKTTTKNYKPENR